MDLKEALDDWVQEYVWLLQQHAPQVTLEPLETIVSAARAVLVSEELEDGFCTTHGAQGFGPDDDNDAQCWVHWVWGDGRECSIEPAAVARVRLLAEEGT